MQNSSKKDYINEKNYINETNVSLPLSYNFEVVILIPHFFFRFLRTTLPYKQEQTNKFSRPRMLNTFQHY